MRLVVTYCYDQLKREVGDKDLVVTLTTICSWQGTMLGGKENLCKARRSHNDTGGATLSLNLRICYMSCDCCVQSLKYFFSLSTQ